MCRLFAFVSPDRSSVRVLLGDSGLERMLSLARLHGDGWGWAGTADQGEQPVVRKSAFSAASDPGFDEAITTPAHAAMVHLRWATSGLPVAERNAHPFFADGIAFEHNGSLTPVSRVRALLAPETLATLRGDTDSEMYFGLVRERIAKGIGLRDAVAHAARRLRDAFPLASLNAIALDATHMVVVRASARSVLSDADLDELALHPHLPEEHNEDYFALRWKRLGDGTLLVGSTGVAEYDWDALPPESVTSIDLTDLTTSTVALHPERR
jgi:predicted glutamine amidotransferase